MVGFGFIISLECFGIYSCLYLREQQSFIRVPYVPLQTVQLPLSLPSHPTHLSSLFLTKNVKQTNKTGEMNLQKVL